MPDYYVLQVHHVRLRDNAIGILDKAKSDHVQASMRCVVEVYSVFQPAFLHLLEASPDRHRLILKSKEGRNQKSRSTMTVPGDDDPVPIATLKDLAAYIHKGRYVFTGGSVHQHG
jgi:hypothetical protein